MSAYNTLVGKPEGKKPTRETGADWMIILWRARWGVAVDIAWQRTCKQQSQMQQRKRPAFSMWSVPVMTSCNNGGIFDGVFFGVRRQAILGEAVQRRPIA
jgi:hypothetical protein